MIITVREYWTIRQMALVVNQAHCALDEERKRDGLWSVCSESVGGETDQLRTLPSFCY